MTDEKKPRFLIDDESGEGWQLFADADNLNLAGDNARAYARAAMDDLLERGKDGDTRTLTIQRCNMTDAEVAALPDL